MDRAFWILIHGSVLGTLILLGFAIGLVGLIRLRPQRLSAAAVRGRVRVLRVSAVTMAVAAWGTVLTGTWIISPVVPRGHSRERPIHPPGQSRD